MRKIIFPFFKGSKQTARKNNQLVRQYKALICNKSGGL